MIEIERKFLLSKNIEDQPNTVERIVQGYLNTEPHRTVRVRMSGIKEFDTAFITVKGISSDNGLSRFEWEQCIHPVEANELMKICTNVIDKTRFKYKVDDHVWEVDVFHGDNEGLVLAEVELENVDDLIKLPDWIGEEVTGDVRYYNSSLGKNPYTQWASVYGWL